jgi:hypothetical protein
MKFLNYKTISIVIFILSCCYACAPRITQADLEYLNGYWEIQEVDFPNGGTKEYRANMDIDFFLLEDTSGFRKKVQPKFNGSFETSDDAQSFALKNDNGTWELLYSNDLSEWTEILVDLNENEMALKNEAGITYRYKRYEPLNIFN